MRSINHLRVRLRAWPSLGYRGFTGLVASLLLASGSVASASPDPTSIWTLRGRVVDAGSRLEGVAAARLMSLDAAVDLRTDALGYFEIQLNFRDAFQLSISAPGHHGHDITVDPNNSPGLMIIPIAWAATGGHTLVARDASEHSPSTVLLGLRDLRAAPARSAEDLLRQVRGMTLVQHGSEGKGHQYFMRGFDAVHGADLALEVEGIGLNEWSNVHAMGYLDLNVVIPELVRTVEVTKGPFSVADGSFALAGRVAMSLGLPRSERGLSFAYTIGSTWRHQLLATWSPKVADGEPDSDSFIAISATHDDGFGVDRSLQRVALNARARIFGLAPDAAGGRLDVLVLAGLSRFGLPGVLRIADIDAGLVGRLGSHDPTGHGESDRVIVAINHALEHGAHGVATRAHVGFRTLLLQENYTGSLNDPINGDRRRQAQQTWNVGLTSTWSWAASPQWALEARTGVLADVLRQHELHIGRSLETVAKRRDISVAQVGAHLGLGGIWRPSEAFTARLGARIDLGHGRVRDVLAEDGVGEGTALTVSPRASFELRAAKTLRVTASYGRGLRPPDARALTGFKPEDTSLGTPTTSEGGASPGFSVSDSAEIAARWTPVPALNVRFAAFGTWIAREAIYDHVAGVSLELNGTRRLGAELIVSVIPFDGVRLSVDLTLVDARFTASSAPVPFAPPWVAGFRADLALGAGFDAGLRLVAIGPRPLPLGATSGTLVMTDATMSWSRGGWRVGLAVENFLNLALREGVYNFASDWREDGQASRIPALHMSPGSPFQVRLTVGGRL